MSLFIQKSGSGTNTIKGDQLYNLLGLIVEENSKPDNDYYITVNGKSMDDSSKRNIYFYYTDKFNDEFIVTKVEYNNGAISNLNITDKSGTVIDL